MMNGNLEMVAALAVPVPGFPIPQIGLAASVEGGRVESLILPGFCDCEEEEALVRTPGYQRRKRALMAAWR
jgi:hypothetical protein